MSDKGNCFFPLFIKKMNKQTNEQTRTKELKTNFVTHIKLEYAQIK